MRLGFWARVTAISLLLAASSPANATISLLLSQSGGTYSESVGALPGDTIILEIQIEGDGLGPELGMTGAVIEIGYGSETVAFIDGWEWPGGLINGLAMLPIGTPGLGLVGFVDVGAKVTGWESLEVTYSPGLPGPFLYQVGTATFTLSGLGGTISIHPDSSVSIEDFVAADPGDVVLSEVEILPVIDEIHVYGTASGGSAQIEIAGETIAVTTTASDTASDVASALAAAVNAHPAFSALGSIANAIGDTVTTTGHIGDASTTDPGLLLHFAPFPTGTLAALYDFENNMTDQVCDRDTDDVIGTAYTTGYEGQALEFDGIDDRITIPTNISPSERPELTMGAWVNPDVVDSSRRAILTQSNGGFDRSLRIDDRNTVSSSVGWATYGGFVGNSDVLPLAGQWTFVSVVYDQASNNARLHVGDQYFDFPGTTLGEGNPKLWVGASPIGDHHFDGVVDNVFLFEQALSIEQVNDIRRLGNPGFDAIMASVSPGEPRCREKVSDTEGGFDGTLTDNDEFGRALEALGDFDGDGVPDAVIGAPVADNGGAVWVVALNEDGTAKSEQKLGSGAGGFTGPLDALDLFGQSIGVFPDLDGDLVQDVVVGAMWDDDQATNAGAIYLLSLNSPSATVKSEVKISNTADGLEAEDWFGFAVEVIGDLDGDGIPELAVSAVNDDDAGGNRGAVYIFFLDATGSVVAEQKISNTMGGFTGALANGDQFGSDLASLGDLDGDEISDLAVGAFRDNTGGTNRGAVWILFMNNDGTVKTQQKIADGIGGFSGALADDDEFGNALARLGDVDGDGVVDLAVGARTDDDAGTNRGAAWVLFLNPDGTVKSHTKISDAAGSFGGRLDNGDWLGQGLASPGDLDGDGVDDLLIGASRDDDGGTGTSAERGAYWALRVAGVATTCGDGVLSALEQCDDGDMNEDDRCDNSCKIIPVPEPGRLPMLLAGSTLLIGLHRRSGLR